MKQSIVSRLKELSEAREKAVKGLHDDMVEVMNNIDYFIKYEWKSFEECRKSGGINTPRAMLALGWVEALEWVQGLLEGEKDE